MGGTIPTELGLLVNLEDIDFQLNQLTGLIPSELALLTTLQVLDLSVNYTNIAAPFQVKLGTSTFYAISYFM
jgi:Leucine-rich repeat (LRR) protein